MNRMKSQTRFVWYVMYQLFQLKIYETDNVQLELEDQMDIGVIWN